MKIAAALGVWPFWGWKIINHGGWFTQVKGRSWQKKRSSLYRSCLHERVILPDYRITSLLQFIHHFYNTFSSLLHHLYITFTSFLQLIRHFHPLCHLYITPFLNVLTAGFPAAPARSHSYAINCPPVHRFRQGERYSFLGLGLNSGRNLMPGSRLHNDSQPQKSSAPFWAVFRG